MAWDSVANIKGPKGDQGTAANESSLVHRTGDETINGVKTVPVGSANSWVFNQPPQVAEGTLANHPVRRDDTRLTTRGPAGGVTSTTVTTAGNLAIDASVSNHRRLLLQANVNLTAPTNGTNGQRLIVEMNGSLAARTVTIDAGIEISFAVAGRSIGIALNAWQYVELLCRVEGGVTTWRVVDADFVSHVHSAVNITSGVLSSLRLPPSLMGITTVTTTNTNILTVDLNSYPSAFGLDITLLHDSGLAPPTNPSANRQVIEVAAFASGGARNFVFDSAFRLGAGVSSRSFSLSTGQVLVAEIEYLTIVSAWVLKSAQIVAAVSLTRTNLAQNPAYKTSGASPSWFGPTGSDRATTSDATNPLPTGMVRTTGFRLLSGGQGLGPNVGTGIAAGSSHAVSAEFRSATAQSAVQIGINYLDSSGAFISGGSSAAQALTAGTPARLGFVSTAPANAARMLMTINGHSAEVFLTGILYEQSGSIGTYFDGDTAGATVNGNGTISITS